MLKKLEKVLVCYMKVKECQNVFEFAKYGMMKTFLLIEVKPI